MIRIPHIVANKARDAGAAAWLDELPDLVADLEREWGIEIGDPYRDGTEAYVARAFDRDGNDVVLKLVLPHGLDTARREITVLEAAAGEGCAALLRHDSERGALLLERLGPSMHDVGLPVAVRHRALCAAAQRIWRPAPDADLPTGAQKADRLAEYIPAKWDDLGRPCAEATIEQAIRCAERRRRAHDDERSRLLHGDVHEWNALVSDEGFKLVDPDGLLAEPEYDLGVMMREDPDELLASGDPWARAHRFAGLTGTDATAIWEWGVVERVSTGLLCVAVGLQPVGSRMLAVADWIATEHASPG